MKKYFSKSIEKVHIVLKDTALRKVFKNAFSLMVGNTGQSIFGMLSIFIAARALQVERFGELILVSYWSLIVLQLFNFQTSHALVKEGSVSIGNSDLPALWGVIKLGVLLDVSTAIIASVIFGIGISITSHLISLDSTIITLLYLYILTMITSIVGAPTAIFRLFDKYNVYAIHASFSGFLKLAFTVMAWLLGGDLLYFGISWIAAQILSNLLLCGLAIREIRFQLITNPLLKPALKIREVLHIFPHIRSRLISTNLSGTLRMIRDLDVLIVGWLLGASAAGLFKIAKQVGTAFMRVIDPVFQAIYPNMAATEESEGRPAVVKMLTRSSLIVGFCGLAAFSMFVAVGEYIITYSLGIEFSSLYSAAVFCVGGTAIWGFSHSYGAALLVWNRHRSLLALNAISSAIYLVSVVIFSAIWGVTGAGAATLLYFVLWGVVAFVIVRKEISNIENSSVRTDGY